MTVEPDKEEPDERGQLLEVDIVTAQLLIGNYRHINRLKVLLQELPSYQSKELFAGSEALTCMMNRAVEDLSAKAVLQSIASGITLTQHLIQVHSTIKPTTQEITASLQAILAGFHALRSQIAKQTP